MRTELLQLLRWIASAGQLRTEEQILDEVVARSARPCRTRCTIWCT